MSILTASAGLRTKAWKLPSTEHQHPLGVTHDLYGNPVAGIEMHGFTIHNASVSSCGRFQVDPSHYQLTAEQGRALNSLNAVVKAAAESAINAGCREI
jgi:hypothetical protein